MLILPIRTEAVSHYPPRANYALIAANLFLFLLFYDGWADTSMVAFRDRYLVLLSSQPAFHQFFTYQFLHADVMHLLGNLLFLWLFGNGVNAKFGDWPYLLFYLGGGAFAGWGHAVLNPEGVGLVGASGAIAAITMAYFVLCPRSRVTVLVWLIIFIHFFEVPAMLLIGVKIIVWDNIISPGIHGAGTVAHWAHLAGYLYGFAGAMGMLLVRALPRDQFDILALWRRWYLRREFASASAGKPQGPLGKVARTEPVAAAQRVAEGHQLDQVSSLRVRIGEKLDQDNPAEAAELYEQMFAVDPRQCLSAKQQLEMARYFYREHRFPQAAAAFGRFLESYGRANEANDIRMLLGIIYARDLRQYEEADRWLTEAMDTLRDAARRQQCLGWLSDVRAALDRPAPETKEG